MTEETAVRIAEALESIASAIGVMELWAISVTVILMFGFLFCILTKD